MKARWLLLCLALAIPGATLADARLERALGDDVVRITFAARGDLEIVSGATPGVLLEADHQSTLDAIELEVADGRLSLRQPEDSRGFFGWLRKDSLRVRVIVRDLEQVEFAGAGDLRVSDVRGGTLRVEIAGAADCVLEALELEELRVSIAGSADCESSGEAERQRVGIAGRGDYHGFELVSARTVVELSGMGDIEVHATEQLDASVSGLGDVEYQGSPELRERVSGWGSVKRARGS